MWGKNQSPSHALNDLWTLFPPPLIPLTSSPTTLPPTHFPAATREVEMLSLNAWKCYIVHKLQSHGLSNCLSLYHLNYLPAPQPTKKPKPSLECCSLPSFISLFKYQFPCDFTCPSSLPCFLYHHLTYILLILFFVSLPYNVSFWSEWFLFLLLTAISPNVM